jgi:hypothetical protein
MTKKVVIQGVAGCYHDAAARQFFKTIEPQRDIEIIECPTFNSMFRMLEADSSLTGVMAIENTIAGALLQNHELLRSSSLTIIGEHKMRISHTLVALPGQTIKDLREVHSHPMALMQCEQWLSQHPDIKMIEAFDTAGAARDIAVTRQAGHGAVCSELAANLYGLDILAKGIETNKRNFTRFLILANPLTITKEHAYETTPDKASIVFTLPHTQGALSKVLTILSFYDMNLSKIQSMPIIGREWEYRFYIDLTFNSYERYIQAIDAARPLMIEFKSLGQYKQFNYE